jgi:hypothetical protein
MHHRALHTVLQVSADGTQIVTVGGRAKLAVRRLWDLKVCAQCLPHLLPDCAFHFCGHWQAGVRSADRQQRHTLVSHLALQHYTPHSLLSVPNLLAPDLTTTTQPMPTPTYTTSPQPATAHPSVRTVLHSNARRTTPPAPLPPPPPGPAPSRLQRLWLSPDLPRSRTARRGRACRLPGTGLRSVVVGVGECGAVSCIRCGLMWCSALWFVHCSRVDILVPYSFDTIKPVGYQLLCCTERGGRCVSPQRPCAAGVGIR